jgi:hypothetical protein
MRWFQRWRELPADDRRLLREALAESWFVTLALRVRPLAALRGNLAAESRDADLVKMAWAVRAAARVVPGAACLAQAVAMQRMLARRGRQSNVELGVAKNHEGLEAHAWLVCDGEIVIGAEQAGAFVPLGAP